MSIFKIAVDFNLTVWTQGYIIASVFDAVAAVLLWYAYDRSWSECSTNSTPADCTQSAYWKRTAIYKAAWWAFVKVGQKVTVMPWFDWQQRHLSNKSIYEYNKQQQELKEATEQLKSQEQVVEEDTSISLIVF